MPSQLNPKAPVFKPDMKLRAAMDWYEVISGRSLRAERDFLHNMHTFHTTDRVIDLLDMRYEADRKVKILLMEKEGRSLDDILPLPPTELEALLQGDTA